MAVRILVPPAGQTTEELTFLRWRVAEGQAVKLGDVLAELETDKAVMELESSADGCALGLNAKEGEMVTVGQTIGWIGEPGEAIEEGESKSGNAANADQSKPEELTTEDTESTEKRIEEEKCGPLRATPAARTLARENRVDLRLIAGSGPEGCIVKADVERAGTAADGAEGKKVLLTKMRRTIAARLAQSKHDAPHFYVAMDVDMAAALALRERLNAAGGIRISINDMIVKAVADALARFPQVNCRFDGDGVTYLDKINIGIAVALDDGLTVPVLPHADRLTLTRIAEQSTQLVAAAREGRMLNQAVGTFTVSNLGMLGVKWFTAIINPPESAILAVGAIEQKLTLNNDNSIVAKPTLTLTLSSDHRVIDGALAARFLAFIRDALQNPNVESQ